MRGSNCESRVASCRDFASPRSLESGRNPDAGMRTVPNKIRRKLQRSTSFEAVVLSEIVYPGGFKLDWHSHELAAFVLTLRGSSTETFAHACFDQTEKGVIARPAGERHSDIYGEQGARCFLIEMKPGWIDGLPQLRTILSRPHFHRSNVFMRLALRAYHEWLENDTASKVAIPALALEMAAYLIREQEGRFRDRPPAWLRRVQERLDDNIAVTPSLSDLAATSAVHPTHLARHFRRYFGTSIGEYLRKRRVDAASELLRRSVLSLTEIALATGFAHHAHFTTVFKSFTGLTPSEFRRLLR